MLDEEQVRELFETRCADLVIPFKEHQLKKFEAKLESRFEIKNHHDR